MAADPDWDDPCAVAAWLKPQLYSVATGGGVVDIRHGDERVSYSQGNYQGLLSLYRSAVSDCARKSGTSAGRRRAFVAR